MHAAELFIKVVWCVWSKKELTSFRRCRVKQPWITIYWNFDHTYYRFWDTNFKCKTCEVECCAASVFLLLTIYMLALNYLITRFHFGKWCQYFLKREVYASKMKPYGWKKLSRRLVLNGYFLSAYSMDHIFHEREINWNHLDSTFYKYYFELIIFTQSLMPLLSLKKL